MAEFLSPAWIAELDVALGALDASEPRSGEPQRDGPFVIEQRVTGPDGAQDRYHVVVDQGRFHAIAGAASDPDFVITTDLESAIAIQRGAVNAQLALAAGHLRLGGDLDQLVARSAMFAQLRDVFATLRAETTYPSGFGPGGR